MTVVPLWGSLQNSDKIRQEDLDVPLKMERLRQWCEDINRVQAEVTFDFVFVDQESFETYKPTSFQTLLKGFTKYKGLA